MYIFKAVCFIISTILLAKAISKEDFDYLFIAIFIYTVAIGIEKV